MFFIRWQKLQAALDELRRTLDLLDRRAERMETILLVREPSSVSAADAYEGLRKQVVNAVTERQAHLAQLVQLDAALANGADREVLAKFVDSWFEHAGLVRVTDPDHPRLDGLFDLVADEGGPVEIVDPAYVDVVTGRVVRPGRARRLPPRPPLEPGRHGYPAGALPGPDSVQTLESGAAQ